MSRCFISLESGCDWDAVFGLRDDVVNNLAQVSRLFENFQLPIRAGPMPENLARVLDVLARSQLVDNIIDEFQQLVEQLAVRHFGFLAEVDELCVRSEASRALLVFIQQGVPVNAPREVRAVELVEFRCDRLEKRGEADRL